MSTPAERQTAFEAHVQDAMGGMEGWRINRAYGVSNSAKVISGGLQLAVLNMDTFNGDTPGWLLLSLIRFAPADEVLFALAVEGDVECVQERLVAMMRAGSGDRIQLREGDDLKYSARTNNVSVYLAGDGLVLRNRGFWDELPADLAPFGPHAAVSKAFARVHSDTPATPGHGAFEFVALLADLLPETRLVIDGVPAPSRPPESPGEDAVPPPFDSIVSIRRRFDEDGGVDEDGLLERLHLALAASEPGGIALVEVSEEEAGIAADIVGRYARAVSTTEVQVTVRRMPSAEAPAADWPTLLFAPGPHDDEVLGAVRAAALARAALAEPRPWPMWVLLFAPGAAPRDLAPIVRFRRSRPEAVMAALGLSDEEKAACRAAFGRSAPSLPAVRRWLATVRGAPVSPHPPT